MKALFLTLSCDSRKVLIRTALAPLCLWLLASSGPVRAAETNAMTEAEAAYTRTLADRVQRIVHPLRIADIAKSNRVHGIIVRQYRDLTKIHAVRDAEIKAAREQAGAGKSAVDAAVQTVRDAARAKLDTLHGEYLAKLSAELLPPQVEKVKDGMTYGVLPLTYGVYLKMLPELTDEQKARIMTWLIEARELAMDGGTSEEKHAVFGKYKGRINNYLSAAGYNLKEAEKNLRPPTAAASEQKAD